MPCSTVLRNVVAGAGHDRAQRILRADDQPELFAGVEHQTDWEKVDLDVDDLAGHQFLDPIEGVSGNGVGRQRLVQVPSGHAQAPVGSSVPQHGSAALGEIVQQCAVVGHSELLKRRALAIQLLDEDEQVHVVGAVCMHPQSRLGVADHRGFFADADHDGSQR